MFDNKNAINDGPEEINLCKIMIFLNKNTLANLKSTGRLIILGSYDIMYTYNVPTFSYHIVYLLQLSHVLCFELHKQ